MTANGFQGYVQLGNDFTSRLLVKNSSGVPINADALPTYRVYGPNGFITSGTASKADSGNVENATNASPVVITDTAHGLTTGAYLTVANVEGNTGANGSYAVTKVNANSFSLDDSTGNGSYTTGGDWNVTGLYEYTVSALEASGFELGESYQIHFTFEISSTQQTVIHSFQVN